MRITRRWPDEGAANDEVMLALHARRSAESIRAWVASRGPGGLAVVLTGTDLYGDLATDEQARESVNGAHRLVVLQELAPAALPPGLRSKSRVIYQSALPYPVSMKSVGLLQAVMVGHLRDVKDPRTLFATARLLATSPDIRIVHVGAETDADLGAAARETEQACPNYRWLGELNHSDTRKLIAESHVLVHTSVMEGGANVIIEAVCSGTPVLASRIDGNLGMLGRDYGGYFEPGAARELARLLQQCRTAPDFLADLRGQCDARAAMFAPQAEQDALQRLVLELREGSRPSAGG